MNSDETQKAYEDSLPLLSKFGSEMAQNEILFKSKKTLSIKDVICQDQSGGFKSPVFQIFYYCKTIQIITLTNIL